MQWSFDVPPPVEWMQYESAIGELLNEFPQLRRLEFFAEEMGLPHVVFGDAFCPWLEGLLTADTLTETQESDITRAFVFIERMLESPDERLENVVLVTILNYLVYYCGLERVAPRCGPLSASWLDRLPPP